MTVQRPATRRARPAAPRSPQQKSFEWKSVLPYVPFVLKLVLAVSLGVLAYVGYRTAVSASFFSVRTVDVDGATHASREEIGAAVRRLSSAGVWQADLDAIARELKELPWVRDAVVSRVLPGGLRVRVHEREPRIIARTSQGKLVWVDDDGVALGTASPDEQDFFVRGIEEGRADEVVKLNRQRVQAALELARDWERAGLSHRVSEVNLDELRDVRVQLAGEDAAVEVRLGREDFVKRFRQALEVLDAQRQTARGPFITYVDVSQGKRAVVGTGATAHFQSNNDAAAAGEPSSSATAHNATEPVNERPAHAAAAAREAKNVKDAKRGAGRPEKAKEEAKEKRPDAPRRMDVAVRPRRVN
jgi:cell division protein FtsQ